MIDEDVAPHGVEIVRGRERGGQFGPFQLIAFGHRVGAQEPLFVDVDAEDQPVAGIESAEAPQQRGPAVDHQSAHRVDAGLFDDRERNRLEGAQSAGSDVEEDVADGQPVADLVGLEGQLGQLRAGGSAAERDLEQVTCLVGTAGIFVVDGPDLKGYRAG